MSKVLLSALLLLFGIAAGPIASDRLAAPVRAVAAHSQCTCDKNCPCFINGLRCDRPGCDCLGASHTSSECCSMTGGERPRGRSAVEQGDFCYAACTQSVGGDRCPAVCRLSAGHSGRHLCVKLHDF